MKTLVPESLPLFLLPVIITVGLNLPCSADHYPHKYALMLLWGGRASFQLEIAKLWEHAFILSAIIDVSGQDIQRPDGMKIVFEP